MNMMTFNDYFTRLYAPKGASRGRTGRISFIKWMLICLGWWKLVNIVFDGFVLLGLPDNEITWYVETTFYLWTFYVFYCLMCRRLHDTGHSSMMVWVAILAACAAFCLFVYTDVDFGKPFWACVTISGLSLLWCIVTCLRRGEPFPNKYGEEPEDDLEILPW